MRPRSFIFVLSPAEKKLAKVVAENVHKDKFLEATGAVVEAFKLKVRLTDDDPKTLTPILQFYLHSLLDGGGMAEAAQILWTPTQFNPTPECSQQVWQLFDDASLGLIMGAASMSKSFTLGVRLFLEWLRDPEYTTVKVIGPSEDHLEQNLFSHLVSLHSGAKLPMPGDVGTLYIGLDRRNQLSAIRGVVVPVGKNKKAGRLQGTKRKPRKKPHPVYGALSRLFIFLDEIENIPAGIWSDLDNVMSNVQDEGVSAGMKIFGAYNPTNPGDEVYKRAEPPFGWADFDVDKHYRWTSTRGWEVLRLDGERSENVIQGKVVYPGLQTAVGLKNIERSAGGKNSPGYMSMGRGAYPVQGQRMTVIPPGMLSKARGELIWYGTPDPVGSCDLALEGRASAIFTTGKWGLATGVRLPPSLEFPQGRTVMFKDPKGVRNMPRFALQVEQQFALPKGDSVAMSESCITTCRRAGIRPHLFCCDRTGHGQGAADLMKHDFGPIIAVNYSQGPSETKLMAEDTKTCKEEYNRLCCELWFAMRKFFEFGYVYVHPQFDLAKVTQQIVQRRYSTIGGKAKVQSKADYMGDGNPSPDEADSLSLLIHTVRVGFSFIPSMKGSGDEMSSDEEDDWERAMYPDGVRLDASNETQFLEENVDPVRGVWDGMQ